MLSMIMMVIDGSEVVLQDFINIATPLTCPK